VARELAFGRETFQRLVREKGALVGWVPTTLRLFAADLAEDCLAAIGLREADDVTLADLAGAALDDCVREGTLPEAVARQTRNLGYRLTTWDAIARLRTGGVTPAALERPARYEQLLTERGLADAAKVFGEAIDAAATSADHDASSLEIEPGATEISGLPHMLVELLVEKGAPITQPSVPDASGPRTWRRPRFRGRLGSARRRSRAPMFALDSRRRCARYSTPTWGRDPGPRLALPRGGRAGSQRVRGVPCVRTGACHPENKFLSPVEAEAVKMSNKQL